MSLIGRLGMTLFFGIFLAAGLFVFFMLSRELLEIISVYGWKETPATIVSSSVVEGKDDDPFSVAVKFRYEWEGRSYTSERFHASSKSYPKYAEASEKIADLPQGTATHCYVDPKDPGGAVLRREGLALGFFLLLPLIFVAVGGGGIIAAWFSRSPKEKPISSSSNDTPGKQKVVVMFVGGLFSLVGAALLVFWFVPTAVRSVASAKWTETPCTVISSRVKSHSDSDGTTYSVDIFYSYRVDGKEYKSNTYGLFGGSSSGYKSKAKVVAQYPKGSKKVCYVNPGNPGDAVLKRGVGWEILFGLIPLVFFGVGLAVFLSAFRKPAGLRGIPIESLSPAAETLGGSESQALKPKAPPVSRLLGMLLFAVVWNGIISVFLWNVIGDFRSGSPDWFLTLFLVPFVLVGLASIAMVVYGVMALANPRCRLEVTPSVLMPGRSVDVAWTMSGAAGKVQRLRIVLEGREEAVYRRGTSTCTDRNAFARFLVADVSSSLEMQQGTARLLVPDGVPPSFNASKNKIIWSLKVHGEILRWPDVLEEYEVPMSGGKS
jgi:hypothetical protein